MFENLFYFFLKNVFKDCFGKIANNQIFEHEKQRIKKSFLHEKCSLACNLVACVILDSWHKVKIDFMLRKN